MNRTMALATIILFTSIGCRKEPTKERGDAPPPVVSATPGLCATGGGKVTDPIAAKLLPTTVGTYCIDPNNEIRTYGKEGKGTIEQVCTELFDGECEVYRSFGLERVVSVRYADGSGTPGTVTVNLSRFESSQSAFGFLTKRIVGDADPAQLTVEPFEAGTIGALGSGVAYVWRGVHVAELSYSNDNEAPDALKASGRKILPQIGAAIGNLLPGERELPLVVRLLPEQARLKLGLTFEPKDLLGIAGVGPGVIGHYRDGDKRYRIMALERANEQAAQDVTKTLRRVEGAAEQKGPPPTVTLTQRAAGESAKIEWVIGRVGKAIIGIGDEDHAPAVDAAKPSRLSAAEKQARLSAILTEVSKRPASGTP